MPATATQPTPLHPKPKAVRKPAALKPAAVLAYLQANPQFFEKHKEELVQSAAAAPGTKGKSKGQARVGGNILSLHAAKAERVSRDAENLKVRHQQLISTARGNAEIADHIFNVIIQLIGCRTLTQLRQFLQGGLAGHLQLEAVRLYKVAEKETATTLTAKQIIDFCPQPLMLSPLNASLHRSLFGPKTNTLKSVCLMALTDESGVLHGLLALGSSDETRFHAGQATTLANFLRRATGNVLAHAS